MFLKTISFLDIRNCIVSMATYFVILKNGSVLTKIHITYISAAAYPTALNLVSNKSLDIARLHDGLICLLSNLLIHQLN